MKLNNDDVLLWGKDNTADKLDTKRAELVKAVKDMGDTYIDTVPTYRRDFQTKSYTIPKSGAYVRNYNFNANVSIKSSDSNNVNVNVIVNEATQSTLKKSGSVNIAKGSEKAIINFKKEDKKKNLKKVGDLITYPNELIKNCKTYDKAGDDCVRFAFATYNSMYSDYVKNIEKYSGYSWGNINTEITTNNNKFAYAMYKLGFEIYDAKIDNSKWFDCVENDTDKDVYINKIDDKFVLKKGDLISWRNTAHTDGHVQFVLEDLGEGENKSLDTFGWGSVKEECPYTSTFKVTKGTNTEKYKNSEYYVVYQGDVQYTRVFRFRGFSEEKK